MNVKNIFLIALLLVVVTTLGAVSASQDALAGDELTIDENMSIETSVDGEILEQTDNAIINESYDSNDKLEEYDSAKLTSSGSFVDVTDAYNLLNEFRGESGVWYWNSDDTTKTVFNTNSTNQLNSLTRDADLEKTAQLRAKELVELFDHTRPDGSICFDIYPNDSWASGENIAYGQKTCAQVTEAWKETNDPYSGQGHRRNMLSTNFNCVGIAGFELNGVIYWVQAFGNRDHPNTNYGTSTTSVNTPSKKITPTIKSSGKITFKAKSKSKKFTVTLKAGKNVIKKAQIILKISKKTLKVKTNKNGKATFNIKLTKKGKYTGKLSFSGNSKYNKVTTNLKITIR